MGIESLTGLAVGEEAVTWSALGRALEWGLGKENMNHRYTLGFNHSEKKEFW